MRFEELEYGREELLDERELQVVGLRLVRAEEQRLDENGPLHLSGRLALTNDVHDACEYRIDEGRNDLGVGLAYVQDAGAYLTSHVEDLVANGGRRLGAARVRFERVEVPEELLDHGLEHHLALARVAQLARQAQQRVQETVVERCVVGVAAFQLH